MVPKSLQNLFYLVFTALFNDFLFQSTDASSPKNFFLELLSIPITLKPLVLKNLTHSDPTRPSEPVTKTYLTFPNASPYQS